MVSPVLLVLRSPSTVAHDEGAVTAGASAPVFDRLDPAAPVANALDLGITRGDGVFETITVIDGIPQALDAHLTRLERSAELLDLPTPDLDAWRTTVFAAVDTHDPVEEAFIKLVYSRGVEGQPLPTGWAWMQQSGDFTRQRTEGIDVVLLDRGYPSTVAQTSPWLLQGAKTLSYAINRAALREAARRGADDVVFVSSDGLLLEGPTATIILKLGETFVTPRPDLGILPGTTQHSVFEIATLNGFKTAYESLTPADLRAADAAWLVSSVRNAAPIRSVDGAPRAVDAQLTDSINTGLAARTT
ncbi:aminodeoxychorismate lyase [Subtercola boreus]|uniref:4-amino-4-deoxychorismate lyase n=1 Tax=Subtercola boreus TaxID=120213 RepID=A0A3E0WB97_9MICO|nr:aminodeoxychorismate lyase [Subtercola boreus]RFA21347.1 4-amino-4-deoxychorismate lyase [Subtercola boreus]RFA21729.1 4-amino-4-deoxychorismate lyase [Subtercola boreus]RFA27699.1 4-amino-4-deoxychorismate lyase [Subtercola boreus]